MRAAFLTGHGGNEVVCLGEREPPMARPGHVVIDVEAATLNRVDLYMRDSGAGITHSLPQIMGVDGAGTVRSCGDGVTGWKPGQPVTLYPAVGCGLCRYCLRGETMLCLRVAFLGEHRDGTLAEQVSVPASSLFSLPGHLDFAEGAALGVAWLTAWRMLVTQAAIRPGETVLIFGIGGGVSQAALQIAKHSGARVFVTSRDQAKRQSALEQGAAGAFANDAGLVTQVLELTEGYGVDVIIENVGQAVWPLALKALARGGRLVTCGATSGDSPSAELRRLFVRQLRIFGSTLGTPGEFADLLRFVSVHQLRPKIEQTYPLGALHQALDNLESGQQSGKIAIRIAA